MVKGNHPQMAAKFRWVKYDNLLRCMSIHIKSISNHPKSCVYVLRNVCVYPHQIILWYFLHPRPKIHIKIVVILPEIHISSSLRRSVLRSTVGPAFWTSFGLWRRGRWARKRNNNNLGRGGDTLKIDARLELDSGIWMVTLWLWLT